ncbi:superoxide dismutase [Fodinibius salsisoli]|uniref:Superoxide dismutase n=1 Tax=Fodinibius salsisoli TaxID=2820877 RepID=A0ABT3PHX3_9BACT|nr:superoxide dismutase [Fodinibius salsisoli]MCW9705512.1 superoxide dismutase [Fodinibius salsisoli]
MSYQLPTLSFEYDALEPVIDAQTMEIHHTKHHQGYTNKFNNAIAGTKLEDASIEEVLSNASEHSDAVRNNGGGYYNHRLFWSILAPEGKEAPEGALAEAIDQAFGSFEAFKEQFADAAGSQFGSGWAWLVVTADDELVITSTANQDNPLMDVAGTQGTPILGLDVWEHAYYLNYQNKRGSYVEAFWKVVDWDAVEVNYQEA